MSPTRAPSDGRVVKRAVDDAQATRIRAEAEVLAAGRMPGVVELIGLEGAPERPELVTGRVHGPDLDRAGNSASRRWPVWWRRWPRPSPISTTSGWCTER